jgi:hypothetical protein
MLLNGFISPLVAKGNEMDIDFSFREKPVAILFRSFSFLSFKNF